MNLKRTSLYAESWNVAIRKKSDILNDLNSQFHVIKNNIDSWVADPFVFDYNGNTYIFAEIYDYLKSRGTIGYAIVEDNHISKWKQIIVEDYHLSYPFIFKFKDDVYIIPESSESQSLYVYKAINFPNKWEKITILKNDVKWVDTTLINIKDNYYAFTTDVSDYENQKTILIHFKSNRIDSIQEIQVDDCKTSRMGGKIFKDNDKLYKVCQDCSYTYGGGLFIKEIDFENNLDGKTVKHILPSSISLDKKLLLDGIHTYNKNEKYEVIDLKTRRFNVINFVCRLINKCRG